MPTFTQFTPTAEGLAANKVFLSGSLMALIQNQLYQEQQIETQLLQQESTALGNSIEDSEKKQAAGQESQAIGSIVGGSLQGVGTVASVGVGLSGTSAAKSASNDAKNANEWIDSLNSIKSGKQNVSLGSPAAAASNGGNPHGISFDPVPPAEPPTGSPTAYGDAGGTRGGAPSAKNNAAAKNNANPVVVEGFADFRDADVSKPMTQSVHGKPVDKTTMETQAQAAFNDPGSTFDGKVKEATSVRERAEQKMHAERQKTSNQIQTISNLSQALGSLSGGVGNLYQSQFTNDQAEIDNLKQALTTANDSVKTVTNAMGTLAQGFDQQKQAEVQILQGLASANRV